MFKKLILLLGNLLFVGAAQAKEAPPTAPNPPTAAAQSFRHLRYPTHEKIVRALFDLIKLRESDPTGSALSPEWFLKHLGRPDKDIEFFSEFEGNPIENGFAMHYGKQSPQADDVGRFEIQVITFEADKQEGPTVLLRVDFNWDEGQRTITSPAVRPEKIFELAQARGLRPEASPPRCLRCAILIYQDIPSGGQSKNVETALNHNAYSLTRFSIIYEPMQGARP